MALSQVVRDEAVAHPFQGGEVEPPGQIFREKAPEELLYRQGVGEEPFIAPVVMAAPVVRRRVFPSRVACCHA